MERNEATAARRSSIGNGDDDEFEEPKDLRKVTVERAPTETATTAASGLQSVLWSACCGAWPWSAAPA